jgi:hypothetical protein
MAKSTNPPFLEAPEGVSIADVTTLSRVARLPDGAQEIKQKMVDRLEGWSKQVGETLLKLPGDRSLDDPEIRSAAESIELGVTREL